MAGAESVKVDAQVGAIKAVAAIQADDLALQPYHGCAAAVAGEMQPEIAGFGRSYRCSASLRFVDHQAGISLNRIGL